MKTSPLLSMLGILTLLLAAPASHASMLGMQNLTVDFTNQKDASTKATWPDTFDATTDGLGWKGDAGWSRDGWIQTQPLELGVSWRPASAVSVTATITPAPGVKTAEFQNGEVYARYSPDSKHWSTWQLLPRHQPKNDDKENKEEQSGIQFRGELCVPTVARKEYGELLWQYQKRKDVPWGSDEDAACRWIVKSQPDFFATHTPFIGYAQIRYEGSFHGGERIKALNVHLGYCIGGTATVPNDPNYKEKPGSWSFKGEAESEEKPSPPKN